MELKVSKNIGEAMHYFAVIGLNVFADVLEGFSQIIINAGIAMRLPMFSQDQELRAGGEVNSTCGQGVPPNVLKLSAHNQQQGPGTLDYRRQADFQ